jgi:hypothetical protein
MESRTILSQRQWGYHTVAKLISTGKHEAIDLKTLHGEQVLMFDEAATDAIEQESDALWLIMLRKGVLQLCKAFSTIDTGFYPLKPKKRRPAAT